MKKMTEEELIQKLGNYTAPVGLYEKTKSMPFLGSVNCNIQQLEAGEWQEVIIDYTVGAGGLADGAWIKATFKFYSDWALFQTADRLAANYVSVEYQAGPLLEGQSPATVQGLKVRFDQKGHERPFQKAIIVDVVDGFLKPGDHIIIRLGDRRSGGPGTRVQTFVETDFKFRCYIDPLGTSRFAAIPGDIVFDVVAAQPHQLLFNGTRLLDKNQEINMQLRVEDVWGNTCVNLPEKIIVEAHIEDTCIFSQNVMMPEQGWATLSLSEIPSMQTGEIKLTAGVVDKPHIKPASFFITVDESLSVPRIFYGDLHVHSDDTVGTNDTVYNLSYGRDVAALDVLGYTANDFQITKARWETAVELCHSLTVENEFVCYPGTEWCGNSCAGGDHNVIFLHDRQPLFPFDKEGNVCRSFEWNEDMSGDTLQPGAWPLEELYATYADDPESHLLMPHVGGRRCNLDWHHPELERLAEVESAWGHFPWLYEDAMRRGYKLGVSANGDEHRGRCGGGVPGTAVFGTKGGLTGIVADKLDRETIGKALRARHTFATTGERLVGLTSGIIPTGKYIQGDEFEHAGTLGVDYAFYGDVGWDEIIAYDHNGVFWQRNLQQEAGYSGRKIRIRWGGARIKDRYRWANWNGKIAVQNGVINEFKAYGFEHSEESCWREDALTVGFHSDTYGDADCIEMDISQLAQCKISIEGTIDGYVKVGNPLDGNPFGHCPTFNLDVSGEELLEQGSLMLELGGTELFVAIERLSDKPMPREVKGTLQVNPENGPHGFRPIYFLGRQIDDGKAWTSAMFVTFV